MMDKIDVQWRCEVCHEEAVTVAWRGRSEDLEPVMVRTKCPICGNVSTRSFRPGTLADISEDARGAVCGHGWAGQPSMGVLVL